MHSLIPMLFLQGSFSTYMVLTNCMRSVEEDGGASVLEGALLEV